MNTTEIIRDELRLRFAAPWDVQGHDLFIRAKALPEAHYAFDRDTDSYTVTAPARFASLVGLEPPARVATDLAPAEHLFPVQRWIVHDLALPAKRFAIWADCGFGKTPMGLEWVRHVMHRTAGRVLIICPKSIITQWCEEAEKFQCEPLHVLHHRKDIPAWCRGETDTAHRVAITNWEKWGDRNVEKEWLDSIRYVAGVVLDESSILKGGGGVIKWNLIKSCRGIEYKLSLTATPAPNDTMEYASQASWLEKLRSEGEILWTFFTRDPVTQEWMVRPHAREAFYRFMSSWSIYIRKASAYGFDDAFDCAEPLVTGHNISMSDAQAAYHRRFSNLRGMLLSDDKLGVTARTKLSQIAKGFIYDKGKATVRIESAKPERTACLVRDALACGKRGIVWTVFDEESAIIMECLNGLAGIDTLHGKHSESERQAKLEAFRHGRVPWLVSKGSLLGLGMNFPFIDEMIFSGFDDSFERFYQSVRRGHRYGRTGQMVVHVPIIQELEMHMWSNLMRKQSSWESDIAKQEANYAEAMS